MSTLIADVTTETVIVESGRTPTTDIIVGVAMIIAALVCAIAYLIILTGIYKDKDLMRMTSYKFMFFLGIVDVVQCFPHTITGFFTIFQTTWGDELPKIMGVLATPFYVAYAIMTVILAINRFVQLASPTWDRWLFSSKGVKAWIGLASLSCLFYMIALSSPYASIVYYPDAYSWDYVYTPPNNLSIVVQKVEEVIEIGGIFVAAFFYGGVLLLLCRTRHIFKSSKNYRVEAKILIQAIVITVYCTILNVFWHNYQVLLPASIWSYMALNFMWILNSGIYPLIYFILNKTIREKVRRAAITRVELSHVFNRNGDHKAITTTAIPKRPSCSGETDGSKVSTTVKQKWRKRFTVSSSPFIKTETIQGKILFLT